MTLLDPTILGLAGAAGSGKDTAADYLCTHYGFVRCAFADGLKAMLEALLEHVGGDHAHLHEPARKQWPIPQLDGHTARHLMQTLGTEWGRDILGRDFWVHALERHMGLTAGHPVHDRIVITDVRFDNEAAAVHRHSGHVLRLVGRSAGGVPAHASEQQVGSLHCDIEIHNRGSIAGLHDLLDGTMDTFGIGRRSHLEA